MANEYDIKMDKLRRNAQKGEPAASEGKSPQQGGSRKRMGSAAPEINLHGIPHGQGVQGGDDADEILRALGRLVDPAGPYFEATIEKMQREPNRYRHMASRLLDIADAPTQAITRAIRPDGTNLTGTESFLDLGLEARQSPVSQALKSGMNQPKGTLTADPLKAAAMAQPRSTERKS
jgi:hypothetical protein